MHSLRPLFCFIRSKGVMNCACQTEFSSARRLQWRCKGGCVSICCRDTGTHIAPELELIVLQKVNLCGYCCRRWAPFLLMSAKTSSTSTGMHRDAMRESFVAMQNQTGSHLLTSSFPDNSCMVSIGSGCCQRWRHHHSSPGSPRAPRCTCSPRPCWPDPAQHRACDHTHRAHRLPLTCLLTQSPELHSASLLAQRPGHPHEPVSRSIALHANASHLRLPSYLMPESGSRCPIS